MALFSLLLGTYLTRALERLHDAADQAARSLVELSSDLLDISKAEAGELTLAETPADLADVVRIAADVVRPIAQAKGYDLAVTEPPKPVRQPAST